MSSLNILELTSNDTAVVILLCLACFRVYLEIIRFDFNALPMTRAFGQRFGRSSAQDFHRVGLFFSIGYILFFAPQILF